MDEPRIPMMLTMDELSDLKDLVWGTAIEKFDQGWRELAMRMEARLEQARAAGRTLP